MLCQIKHYFSFNKYLYKKNILIKTLEEESCYTKVNSEFLRKSFKTKFVYQLPLVTVFMRSYDVYHSGPPANCIFMQADVSDSDSQCGHKSSS